MSQANVSGLWMRTGRRDTLAAVVQVRFAVDARGELYKSDGMIRRTRRTSGSLTHRDAG